MRKALKYLILFLPLIVVGILALKAKWLDADKILLPNGQEVPLEQLSSQEVLSLVAEQTNKALPKKVDKEMELRSVEGLEGELVYNYVNLNTPSDQFDKNQFINEWTPKAIERACESPDMEIFLTHGVRAHYSFRGNDRGLIGDIVVTPNQCGH
jgi:hypothetical protein